MKLPMPNPDPQVHIPEGALQVLMEQDHLRWPLAQHGGERHWVPASESPVPEGVRQGPRRNVSPFSEVTKRQIPVLAISFEFKSSLTHYPDYIKFVLSLSRII